MRKQLDDDFQKLQKSLEIPNLKATPDDDVREDVNIHILLYANWPDAHFRKIEILIHLNHLGV